MIMAGNKKNEARRGVPIVFGDGVERVIYPVSLRGLRKFMAIMKAMDEASKSEDEDGVVSIADQMNEENIDLMVDAAQLILSFVDPDVAENRDDVEDLVDIRNFNQMVSAAMGTDPNE